MLTESNEWIIINITDPFKPLEKVRQSWIANTNQKRIHYLEHCEAMNCMTTSSCTLNVKGKVHQSKCPLGGLWKAWRYANSNLTRPTSKGAQRCHVVPLRCSSQQGSIQAWPGFLHQSGSVSSFREERPNGKKCTTSSPPPRAAIMEHPWSLKERTSHLKSLYSVSVIIHGHHFLRI